MKQRFCGCVNFRTRSLFYLKNDPFMHLQQVTFRADKQVRKTNHVMKGVAMGDVGPNEECKWEDEVKNIPPVPPTKLGGSCKNIEVKYFLTVRNVIVQYHTTSDNLNLK